MGFEPTTCRLQDGCSTMLSYDSIVSVSSRLSRPVCIASHSAECSRYSGCWEAVANRPALAHGTSVHPSMAPTTVHAPFIGIYKARFQTASYMVFTVSLPYRRAHWSGEAVMSRHTLAAVPMATVQALHHALRVYIPLLHIRSRQLSPVHRPTHGIYPTYIL